MTSDKRADYWAANLRLLASLLSIWFTVSFGCGILLIEPLNAIRVGGYPLGFWFAEQGSIYTFVLLTFIYAIAMSWLDKKYNVSQD
jgi:putative solute:sodium symporter small subunit